MSERTEGGYVRYGGRPQGKRCKVNKRIANDQRKMILYSWYQSVNRMRGGGVEVTDLVTSVNRLYKTLFI